MKIALTGHRPGPKLNEDKAFEGLLYVLTQFQEMDFDDLVVITGGANGADRLWARAAARKGIPFHLYVPRGYAEHYRLTDWFFEMRNRADMIFWTQEEGVKFDPKFNFVRNIQMIEAADEHVVCSFMSPQELLEKTKNGGTRHATNEILKRSIIPIWVNSLTGEVEGI